MIVGIRLVVGRLIGVVGRLIGLVVLVGVGSVVGVGLHVDMLGGVLGRGSVSLLLALPPAVADDGEDDDNGEADDAGDDYAYDCGCSEALVVVVVAVGRVGGAVPPVVAAAVVAGIRPAVGRHLLNNDIIVMAKLSHPLLPVSNIFIHLSSFCSYFFTKQHYNTHTIISSSMSAG